MRWLPIDGHLLRMEKVAFAQFLLDFWVERCGEDAVGTDPFDMVGEVSVETTFEAAVRDAEAARAEAGDDGAGG